MNLYSVLSKVNKLHLLNTEKFNTVMNSLFVKI